MRFRQERTSRRQHATRRGISLLEVLAALAIFLTSIVVISQMVESSARSAQKAQRLTKAALLAESVMNELASGARPMSSVGNEQMDENDPAWIASVSVQPEAWTNVNLDGQFIAGLNSVQVTVAWSNGTSDEAAYTLTRVLLDPRLQLPNVNVPASTPQGSAGGANGGQGGGGAGGGGNP